MRDVLRETKDECLLEAGVVGHRCDGSPSASEDAPSFDEIFSEHRGAVYALALRFLGSPEDAEDVTQEVFTKVWRNLDSFNSNSSVKTWIYRIAINSCVDHRRKPWKRLCTLHADLRGSMEEGSARPMMNAPADAEHHLLAVEKADQVRRAIRRLKPHLKAVLVMKELEEMSYDEISSRLGLSTGTISSRLNRARKALEEAFQVVVPKIKPIRLAEQS